MKTKHFIITAIASYFLFLLAYTPASSMITTINDSFPQLKAEGISGTIWDGSAQRITLSNKYTFDNANWSVCAWRLITGEACVKFNTKYNNNNLHSEVGINIFGTLVARNLQIALTAKEFGENINLPIGELSGDVSLNIASIEWINELIPDTEGIIKWGNAAITFADKVELGTVTFQISNSDEFPITAIINNRDGQITVEGHTNISDDGTYTLELRLQPGNNAGSNLRKSLGMFTKKQSDGSYLVQNSGNLKQLGII